MRGTRRFSILLFVGTLPLGLATLRPELLWIGISFDAVALLLLVLDGLGIPRRRLLSVRRSSNRHWRQGYQERVVIELENRSRRRFRLLIDERTPLLRAETMPLRFDAPPRSRCEFEYTLRCDRRGEVVLEDASVRALGPLGLAVKNLEPASGERVIVHAAAVHAALQRSRRCGLEPGLLSRSRVAPVGARDLRAGSARSAGCNLGEHLLIAIDCGRASLSGPTDASPLDDRVGAAALLARSAIDRGDRVGLLAVDGSVRSRVPLRHGDSHLRSILLELSRIEEGERPFDAGVLARAVALMLGRRGCLVVFTDLARQLELPADHAPAELESITGALVPRLLTVCVAPAVAPVNGQGALDARTAERVVAALEAMERFEGRRARLEARGLIVVSASRDRVADTVVRLYARLRERGLP